MHRFFIEQIQGDKAILTDAEQLHHIKDVLRLKVDDKVTVFDGKGHDYIGVIAGINKQQVEFKVKLAKVRHINKTKLTVACAIPRGSRMDDIIDHLTQLGVERIIPMITERVVVKLDDARMEAKLRRWQKIAQSAARQCQRSTIPVISSATSFGDAISDSQKYNLKLIPHLSGKRTLIKDILAKSKPKNIIVLIGPEGDFTPEEVDIALHNDFTPVSLGDTVLRVTTAAIAVASYIKFALDKQ